VQGEARLGIEVDEPLPAIGSVFDGRFAIEQLLGRGGMGCVLLARNLELEQAVALKLLRPGHADSERGAVRLIREARASARIKSAHVVRVLDVVKRQQATPYIVMEYLEGIDLSRHIAKRGPLSVAEAASIVAQACEAVGEGHRLGIVHRDLKPSNVFLCERGAVAPLIKVLDFGISKTEDESAEALTHSHALLGSPVYTAPEQLQSSHRVDGRADIWSLGVVLYECVTGQRPFAGGTLAQVCTQILQAPPVPLEEHRADLPADFRALVLRCLEKAPADRFGSIDELLTALQPFAPQAAASSKAYLAGIAGATRGSSPELPSSRGPGSDTFTGSTEYDTRVAQEHRNARFRVGRVFWLAAVLASLLAFWAYGRRRTPHADGTQVSAASAPAPQSPPLPVTALVLPASAAPESAPSGAALPALSATSASRTKPATPGAASRKVPAKPASPAAPTGAPWVESR
jgi:serine/threonine protein kinase